MEFDPAILRARLFAHVRAVKREVRLSFFLKKKSRRHKFRKTQKNGRFDLISGYAFSGLFYAPFMQWQFNGFAWITEENTVFTVTFQSGALAKFALDLLC